MCFCLVLYIYYKIIWIRNQQCNLFKSESNMSNIKEVGLDILFIICKHLEAPKVSCNAMKIGKALNLDLKFRSLQVFYI